MAAASVCVPRVSCSCPLPLLGDCPRPAGRSSSASYQITAFTLSPSACEILCTPFTSEMSLSLSFGTPEIKPCWPSKLNAVGLIFLVQDPQAGELSVGLVTLTPVGEFL